MCAASASPGVGFYHVVLERFDLEAGLCSRSFSGLEGVDNWSVGYIRGDEYHAMTLAARTKRNPVLPDCLDAPVYSGRLAICVSDVTGRAFCYEIDPE